jgi:hypothetical protein
MNKWKSITGIVMFGILALVVAVLVYDAVAISKGGTEASISSIIINMSYTMPFATHIGVFFCGVLFGHLFWRMKPNKDTIKNNIDKII